LYAAMKQEFVLLSNVFSTYLPPVYPYDVVGGEREIKQTDFDDKIDILPVADPNIFSMTQRIATAQTELQLAQSNPQMHNLYEAYRDMYEAMGVKNIDQVLPPPPRPEPKNPAVEHIDALAGKPFQAFTGQDHQAHIAAHVAFMATSMAKNNPQITASLEKNIFEHIALMADEQVQMEMRDKIVKIQELQQLMQTNQQVAQNPEVKGELDRLVLELENMRKMKEDEARINLDKSKLLMNRDIQEDKMEQNEELAVLRAETSLQKQRMSNRAKARSDATKRFDVTKLKGPRR
jgi:hypothetical protein